MADLGGVFDSSQHSASSVVPLGDYEMIAIKSEVKPTNDGTGKYLKVEFQITKGEFQNRRVFKNFNLWLSPEKEEAINIAKGQFSQFCRAVGVLTPRDSSELHNIPFKAKVKVKTSPGYDDQNEITKFEPKPQTVSTPVTAATGSGW